jgi:hypothetical protein
MFIFKCICLIEMFDITSKAPHIADVTKSKYMGVDNTYFQNHNIFFFFFWELKDTGFNYCSN